MPSMLDFDRLVLDELPATGDYPSSTHGRQPFIERGSIREGGESGAGLTEGAKLLLGLAFRSGYTGTFQAM
jgi:hypothetical protein